MTIDKQTRQLINKILDNCVLPYTIQQDLVNIVEQSDKLNFKQRS